MKIAQKKIRRGKLKSPETIARGSLIKKKIRGNEKRGRKEKIGRIAVDQYFGEISYFKT